MICCRAAWVLPISSPPIRGGWITIANGRIVDCGGDDRRPPGDQATSDVDFGDTVILPGLVNAHTHLELSYLRGRVPAAASLVSWVRALMAERRGFSGADSEILQGVHTAIDEATAGGTAVVGDITNSLITAQPLAQSGLGGVIFYELIGFNPTDSVATVANACRTIRGLKVTGVRASLAAHAPYSVAPSMLQAIVAATGREGLRGCSVHLAESAEEMEFIHSGHGPWRQLLEDLGVWNPGWKAPGVSPTQYLDEQGFLGPDVLAVHGVQMSAHDLATLKARGSTLVACPRSNRHTGAGAPPVEKFYRSGVPVALGTDSLASTPDLNLFSELAEMRLLARSVPASAFLASATVHGARALGVDADYGAIEPGRRARLIAVSVPSDVDDVEEYLVSGIHPEQVRWVDTA